MGHAADPTLRREVQVTPPAQPALSPPHHDDAEGGPSSRGDVVQDKRTGKVWRSSALGAAVGTSPPQRELELELCVFVAFGLYMS